jgi:hypothetical protein
MPKIEVWKCPKSGKVFFGRDEYGKHITALRTRLNEERVWKRERSIIRERVWYAIENISSPKVLAEYIKKHFHDIMISYNGASPVVAEVIREIELKEFWFENLNYREHCSNSHNAPRDGVTNWSGRDDDKPTGYPGFSGRVKYVLDNEPNFGDKRLKVGKGNIISIDINNALKYIGVRTGGGGGCRNDASSYEVTLFLSDFRSMKKAYFHAKLEDRDFMES